MEVKGKYVVVFDTICDGLQTATDEEGNIVLFDSEEEAFKELFDDAIASLEGTDDSYFEENELDKEKVLKEMEEISKSGDVERMKKYLEENPDCNYHEESVESAETFVLGRKAIFTGQGVTIQGTPLKDL